MKWIWAKILYGEINKLKRVVINFKVGVV